MVHKKIAKEALPAPKYRLETRKLRLWNVDWGREGQHNWVTSVWSNKLWVTDSVGKLETCSKGVFVEYFLHS